MADKTKLYGKDAAELLRRWDDGTAVFTIEMGGLGPGYEQVIHIAAFEMLRHLLATKPDSSLWADSDIWAKAREEIDATVMPVVDHLGMSGAQHGAAMSLATAFYMSGPEETLGQVSDDRHIQVSRTFPEPPAETAAAE